MTAVAVLLLCVVLRSTLAAKELCHFENFTTNSLQYGLKINCHSRAGFEAPVAKELELRLTELTSETVLNELKIKHALLTRIPPVICRQSDLRVLLVFHNKIEELTVDCFRQLSHLTTFDANDNLISKLDEGLFSTNNMLNRVYLASNRLTSFCPTNGSRSSITFLRLDDNRIEELRPDCMRQMPLLATLSANDNSLCRLSDDLFDELHHLKSLYLKHNNLQDFCPHYTHDSPIRILHLNFNNITSLRSDCFSRMFNLLHFEATNNAVFYISDGVFDGLDQLQYVNLSNNRINAICSNIATESAIAVLDLSLNLIANLNTTCLAKFRSLEHLSMANNRILRL